MNCKTLFRLLLILLSFFCAQGYWWVAVGSWNSAWISPTSNFQFGVNLMAGRKYSIIAYGENGMDTTLNATDPSGYWAFNNNWGGSYVSGGVSYAGSSALNFTPNASGLLLMTTASLAGEGIVYVYVTDITPCPTNCTSKCLSLFEN